MTNEEKINQEIKDLKVDTNLISDGFHTFGELYDHRIALYIALCSQLEAAADELGKEHHVWKSRKHSDGSEWAGWFIMGIFTEKGKQISYHLPDVAWGYVEWVKELEKAPEWDGHTPADVVDRISKL